VKGPVPAQDSEVQELWEQLKQVHNPAVEKMMNELSGVKEYRLDSLVKHVERAEAPAAEAVLKSLEQIRNPVAGRVVAYCRDLAQVTYDDAKKTQGVKTTVKELPSFDLKQLAMQITQAGGDVTKYMGKYGLWQGLPVLIVVLLGGFTTNFIWCVILNIRNKTGHEYFSPEKNTPIRRDQETIIETAIDAPSEEVVEHMPKRPEAALPPARERVPLVSNYFFAALAGTTWYMQFFFYSMGETQMGDYKFSSWTLHMASIIIFSTLWGIALKEWKGSSLRTHVLIALGLVVLVGSTLIVGYGNYLAIK